MQSINRIMRRLLFILLLIAIAWGVLANYSYVFSKNIKGEVIEVERMTQPSAIIGGGQMTSEQLFSFAVMVRTFDGKIFSASSEDRQWAVAKKGYCVESKFFPYPPWNFEKADTFFNARLVRVFDCKSEAPPTWQPAATVMLAPSGANATPAPTPVLPLPTPVPAK
jgi:hypothetical protein